MQQIPLKLSLGMEQCGDSDGLEHDVEKNNRFNKYILDTYRMSTLVSDGLAASGLVNLGKLFNLFQPQGLYL